MSHNGTPIAERDEDAEVLRSGAGEDDPAAPEGTLSERWSHHRHRRPDVAANVRLAVLVVVLVVVGALTGWVGAALLPGKYAARAEIQYSLAQAMPNELLREDRRLITQVVLLQSRVVVEPVAVKYGISPEDLARKISAEVVESSEIIGVELRDTDRGRAQAMLTDVVNQYLAVANTGWMDPVHVYLQFQLGEVQRQLRQPDVSADSTAVLQQRAAFLSELLDPLAPKPPNTPDAAVAPPAKLLVPPYPVAGRVGITPKFAAAAGAAAAVVVAAFVVLVAVRRRTRE